MQDYQREEAQTGLAVQCRVPSLTFESVASHVRNGTKRAGKTVPYVNRRPPYVPPLWLLQRHESYPV